MDTTTIAEGVARLQPNFWSGTLAESARAWIGSRHLHNGLPANGHRDRDLCTASYCTVDYYAARLGAMADASRGRVAEAPVRAWRSVWRDVLAGLTSADQHLLLSSFTPRVDVAA